MKKKIIRISAWTAIIFGLIVTAYNGNYFDCSMIAIVRGGMMIWIELAARR